MTALDRTVAAMMAKFGTTAFLNIAISEEYDPETSENVVNYHNYPVRAMFFDYVRKTEGEGTEGGTPLVRTGDKQVYIQPPQKMDDGIALPHIAANRDTLKVGSGNTTKIYKIITVKQLNPSLTADGCVLYELYVRE